MLLLEHNTLNLRHEQTVTQQNIQIFKTGILVSSTKSLIMSTSTTEQWKESVASWIRMSPPYPQLPEGGDNMSQNEQQKSTEWGEKSVPQETDKNNLEWLLHLEESFMKAFVLLSRVSVTIQEYVL